jgi:hypothetical protein
MKLVMKELLVPKLLLVVELLIDSTVYKKAARCLYLCFFLSLPLLCAYKEAASNAVLISIQCF